MASTNILTSQSYTNKDFGSIYEELLNVAKQLSTVWDPTISNESDPGVVLLKLNAIIGDKNNYNIDSNVLEFYPETASQELNIRNIYKQLGYRMPWYRSGKSTITINTGDIDGQFVLPRFTQFCDVDKTKIFTSTEDVTLKSNDTKQVPIIAGKYSVLSINGTSQLTYQNLDSNNRIYFPDNNVAENGIFITTYVNGVKVNDYNDWYCTENNLLEPSYSKCYEFGVDARYGTPYIEFQSSFSDVVTEAFELSYVITDGEANNVNAFVINQLFDTNTSVVTTNNATIQLSDVLIVENQGAILDCYDPETIEESKQNYKKVLGTFKTLVSLRDYLNYMQESGLVSNAAVTDRTCDSYSSTYNMMVTAQGKTRKETFTQNTANSLAPFDLKLYGLQYVGNPITMSQYQTTFKLCNDYEVNDIVAAIEDVKHLQHDIHGPGQNKLTILKNKYELNFKLSLGRITSDSEKSKVIEDVQETLLQSLNSNVVEFGEAISYTTVHNLIKNSNALINYVSLDYINFYTFAPYFDDNWELKEVCISSNHPYTEGNLTGSVLTDKSGTIIKPVEGKLYLDIATQYVYSYSTSNGYELYSDKRAEFGNWIVNNCLISNIKSTFDYDNVLSYNLLQKFKFSAEVKELSAAFNVSLNSLENTSDALQLNDNEIIKFVSPTLRDLTSYSTYVKYIYHGNSVGDVLPAEDNYELTGNEWLALFWKVSTSDYRYSFIKYDAGTIVKSTVTIPYDVDAASKVANLSAGQQAVVVDSTINGFITTYTDGVLSGDAKITIREKDQVVIQNSRYNKVYFITNNIETINGNSYYSLFEGPKVTSIVTDNTTAGTIVLLNSDLFIKQVEQNNIIDSLYEITYTPGASPAWKISPNISDDTVINITSLADWGLSYTAIDDNVQNVGHISLNKGSYQYMLKTGEYFIHNISNRLNIYGSGTLLTRNNIGLSLSSAWQVPVIDAELVLMDGINAFNNNQWYYIDTQSESLVIQGTTFVNVLPGGEIQLQGKQSAAATLNITPDGAYVISAEQSDYNAYTGDNIAPYSMDMTQNVITPISGNTVLNVYPEMGTVSYVANDNQTSTAPVGYVPLELSTASATDEQIRNFASTFPVGNSYVLNYTGTEDDRWNNATYGIFTTEELSSNFGIVITNLATRPLAAGDEIVVQLTTNWVNNSFVVIEGTNVAPTGNGIVSGDQIGIHLKSDYSTRSYVYSHIVITYSDDLSKVIIQYKNDSDSEWQQLETSSVEGFNYTAQTIMTLNIVQGETTQIYPGQTIYVTTPDGDVVTVTAADEDERTLVAATSDIILEDESSVNVSTTLLDGTISYPTLHVFSTSLTPTQKIVQDRIEITDKVGSIEFNQADGYYILPLYINELNGTLKLQLDAAASITVPQILTNLDCVKFSHTTGQVFLSKHPEQGRTDYEYDGANWICNDSIVNLADEGITITGSTIVAGSSFSVFNVNKDIEQILVNGAEIIKYGILPIFSSNMEGTVDQTHTLTISDENGDTVDGTVYLGNLLKVIGTPKEIYSTIDLLTSINSSNNYLHDMNLIDINTDSIDDPLLATEFFNTKHKYNKLTIGEMAGFTMSFIEG